MSPTQNKKHFLNIESHMLFICPECGACETSQHDWQTHLNDLHEYSKKSVEDLHFKEINHRYHECQICNSWIPGHQMSLLLFHRFLHLPYNRTFKCRHCEASFVRKKSLSEHLHRFHNNHLNISLEEYIIYKCPQCGQSIANYEKWLKHINTEHSETHKDLRMTRIMGSTNHQCLDCKKVLYTSCMERLQRHRFSHLPYNEYFECSHCGLKRNYKAAILKHFILEHPKEFQQKRNKMPMLTEEWGDVLSDYDKFELERLLTEFKSSEQDNMQEKSALSRKTLKPTCTTIPAKRSANEIALDESLRDFEEILKADVISKPPSKMAEIKDLYKNFLKNDLRQTGVNKDDINIPIMTSYKPLKVKEDRFICDSLQKLLKLHINFLCPMCGIEFRNQTSWRSHVFKQHNLNSKLESFFKLLPDKKSHACTECEAILPTTKISDLQKHHFEHMPYQTYLKCVLCQCTKSSKAKILVHLRHNHGEALEPKLNEILKERNFKCSRCNNTFSNEAEWYQHHSKECSVRNSEEYEQIAAKRNDLIKENSKILEHLNKARVRIHKIAIELQNKN